MQSHYLDAYYMADTNSRAEAKRSVGAEEFVSAI
jgi:hypothetical protein